MAARERSILVYPVIVPGEYAHRLGPALAFCQFLLLLDIQGTQLDIVAVEFGKFTYNGLNALFHWFRSSGNFSLALLIAFSDHRLR